LAQAAARSIVKSIIKAPLSNHEPKRFDAIGGGFENLRKPSGHGS